MQRGGAGVVSHLHTTSGPASAPRIVSRFTFAVRLARMAKTRAKRAAAVADHLEALTGAVVIAERPDCDRLWLTVAVPLPVTVLQAQTLAETCPEYVARSWQGLAP